MIEVQELHQEYKGGQISGGNIATAKARLCTLPNNRAVIAISNHDTLLEILVFQWKPGTRTWTRTDRWFGTRADLVGPITSDGGNLVFVPYFRAKDNAGHEDTATVETFAISDGGKITESGSSGPLSQYAMANGSAFLGPGRLLVGATFLQLLTYQAPPPVVFTFADVTTFPPAIGTFGSGLMTPTPGEKWVTLAKTSGDPKVPVLVSWHLDGSQKMKVIKHAAEPTSISRDPQALCQLQENPHRIVTAGHDPAGFRLRAWHVDSDGLITVHGHSDPEPGASVALAAIDASRFLSASAVSGNKIRFVDWAVSKHDGKLKIDKQYTADFAFGETAEVILPPGPAFTWQAPLLKEFAVPAVVIGSDRKLRLVVWYDSLKFGPEGGI